MRSGEVEGIARPRAEPAPASVALRESFVVFGLVGILYALLLPGPFAPGAVGDDAAYIALGRAIASGEGYRSVWFVGEPVHTKYPPGLPLILAGLWALFGELSAVVLKALLLNVLVAGASASLLWWLARSRLGMSRAPTIALVLSAFLLDGLLHFYAVVLSEPYFILGWAAALTLTASVVRAVPSKGREEATGGVAEYGFRGTLLALALGVTLGATALFRTQAVFLIPAVLLALLLQKVPRGTLLTTLAAAVLPLIGWAVLRRTFVSGAGTLPLPDEVPYWEWLPLHDPAGLVRVATLNGLAYWNSVAATLGPWPTAGLVASGVLVVFCLAGAVVLLRRAPEVPLTLGAMAGVVLLWPSIHERLGFSLLPVAAVAAAFYLDRLLDRAGSRTRVLAAGALVVLLPLLSVHQVRSRGDFVQAAHRQSQRAFYPPSYTLTWATDFLVRTAVVVSADSVGSVAPEVRDEEVILTPWPAGVYLLTGEKTISSDPAESRLTAASLFDVPGRYVASVILEHGVDLVVAGHEDFASVRDIRSIRRRCPDSLRPLTAERFSAPPVVYRVEPAGLSCLRESFLEGVPAAGPGVLATRDAMPMRSVVARPLERMGGAP